MNDVPMEKIETSIKEFSALGIEVMFTELDLSTLPNPQGRPNSADINQLATYNEKSIHTANPFRIPHRTNWQHHTPHCLSFLNNTKNRSVV